MVCIIAYKVFPDFFKLILNSNFSQFMKTVVILFQYGIEMTPVSYCFLFTSSKFIGALTENDDLTQNTKGFNIILERFKSMKIARLH
ncbi:MAG: hypothetical protein AMS26_13680 [Bacteroides sp. SM23_62]|nr:MAG: hypothetical protein AMS26_13680 [Bacteroides sp. SM23_62]